MTAIVVSFPQERTFRSRQDQIEMRKAYRIVRSHYPGIGPSYLWERALFAIRVAETFKTKVENASGALKKESEKKAKAHQDFRARQPTAAAPVLAFPRDRIVRDRQAQIDMRKAFQHVRRRLPQEAPAHWWEVAVSGFALKAAWDEARLKRESAPKSRGISEDRLVELAGKLMARRQELYREAAAEKTLAKPGVRERFDAKLAELADGMDLPPSAA